MVHCKQLNFPTFPSFLERGIVAWAHLQLENKVPFISGYRGFNTNHKKTISYVESEEEYTARFGLTGGVYFYILPQHLITELRKHVAHIPELNNFDFKLQIVTGGNHVGPHVDDRNARDNGPLYILQTGGDNVTTTWWEPKEEFKDRVVPDRIGIPYDNLIKVEEHILQASNWYWLDFGSIHSVENITGIRLALAM